MAVTTDFKVIGIGDPGSSVMFGGDDLDKIAKILNGTDLLLNVNFNNEVHFKSNKFVMWDFSNTYKIFWTTSTETANRTIGIPVLGGNRTLAFIDQPNQIFTTTQKITSNAPDVLYTYRQTNSQYSGVGIYFNLQNASSAEVNYASILGVINSNVAGSESGGISFQTKRVGSALAERMNLSESGYLLLKDYLGNGVIFNPTGLTGLRTFTFPDYNTQLVGTVLPAAGGTPLTFTKTATLGIAELLMKFTVSDDPNSYLMFQNGAGTNGVFVPTMVGANQSNNNASMIIMGIPTAALDTGTTGVNVIEAQTTSGTAIATRPLLAITTLWANKYAFYPTYADFLGQGIRNVELQGIKKTVVTKTAAYTLVATDTVILGDATTAAFTLTLPTAASSAKILYTIKKIDASANAVTIAAAGTDKIDGAATKVLSAQYQSVDIVCDGTNWDIVSNTGFGGALTGLSDVTITSPTNGQILQYNGTKWVNAAAGASNTLASMTDVSITTPANNNLLQYNSTTGKWTNVANPTISTIINTGTLTLPTSTDTLMGRATIDTMTNKTATAIVINGVKFAVSATKTGAYTATLSDTVIPVDATTAAFTVTLPAASGNAGLKYVFVKMDTSANAVTIDANASETINGNLTMLMTAQYQMITLYCNGTNWVTAPNSSERRGKATGSGNGTATAFTIAHGLGATPYAANVQCSSYSTAFTYALDATNITVTFTTAPPTGTNNVVFYWSAIV